MCENDDFGQNCLFSKVSLLSKEVNKIVLTNRDRPPDYIIETVENLTGGAPFDQIEDVIDPAELAAISDRYKEIALYSKEAASGR